MLFSHPFPVFSESRTAPNNQLRWRCRSVFHQVQHLDMCRTSSTWLRCSTLSRNIRSIINNNNSNNNIRLLETADKPQSLDNNVRINVNDGQSPPRQLRVSSLPTAVTRWGDRPPHSCHERASILFINVLTTCRMRRSLATDRCDACFVDVEAWLKARWLRPSPRNNSGRVARICAVVWPSCELVKFHFATHWAGSEMSLSSTITAVLAGNYVSVQFDLYY